MTKTVTEKRSKTRVARRIVRAGRIKRAGRVMYAMPVEDHGDVSPDSIRVILDHTKIGAEAAAHSVKRMKRDAKLSNCTTAMMKGRPVGPMAEMGDLLKLWWSFGIGGKDHKAEMFVCGDDKDALYGDMHNVGVDMTKALKHAVKTADAT